MTRWLPLRTWPHHYRNGRNLGAPVCCVVRWLVGPHGRQGTVRGFRRSGSGELFVVCGVLHRRRA